MRQVHRYGNILWICCNNPLHFVACTKIGTSCSRRSRYSWRRLPVWSLKVVRWGLRTELCKVVGTSEKESNHLYKIFLSAETILGVDLFFLNRFSSFKLFVKPFYLKQEDNAHWTVSTFEIISKLSHATLTLSAKIMICLELENYTCYQVKVHKMYCHSR